MSSMSNRNSAAAQAYAEKKKAALQNANRLAAERKRMKELQADSTNSNNMMSVGRYQKPNIIGCAGGAEVESVFSNEFAERLVIRPSQSSHTSHEPARKPSNPAVISIAPPSAMARKQPKNSFSDKMGATPPSLMEAALPPTSSTITSTVRATGDNSLTIPHSSHFGSSSADIFLSPPTDPSGTLVTVSDLPLLCSCPITTTNGTGIAVGGADHRAYIITNPLKGRQEPRVTTLGGRTDGHSDWITGIGVLANYGLVATTAMDGKLCLWSVASTGSTTSRAAVRCSEVAAHRGSISKLLVDETSSKCLTLGYDGYTHLWDVQSGTSRRNNLTPMLSVQGRGPTVEGYYKNNTLVTGDRSGTVLVYDVATGAVIVKYPAHKGCVTGIVDANSGDDTRVFSTGGGDGFVKV